MMEGEIQKLVQMPERLKDRVVGQDEAVRLVSNAILRNRAGLERSAAAHRQLHLPGTHRRG